MPANSLGRNDEMDEARGDGWAGFSPMLNHRQICSMAAMRQTSPLPLDDFFTPASRATLKAAARSPPLGHQARRADDLCAARITKGPQSGSPSSKFTDKCY